MLRCIGLVKMRNDYKGKPIVGCSLNKTVLFNNYFLSILILFKYNESLLRGELDDAKAIAKNPILDSCLVPVRHYRFIVLHGIHIFLFAEYFPRSRAMPPVSACKCFITFQSFIIKKVKLVTLRLWWQVSAFERSSQSEWSSFVIILNQSPIETV